MNITVFAKKVYFDLSRVSNPVCVLKINQGNSLRRLRYFKEKYSMNYIFFYFDVCVIKIFFFFIWIRSQLKFDRWCM